jgi:thiamine pyrophosphokinase
VTEHQRTKLYAQQQIVVACDDAIAALLDDTGPLVAIPRYLRQEILGDLHSAVRTLERARDKAEDLIARLEGGD